MRASRAASIVGDGGSPAPDPPRLSLARQDLDDDSFHEAPPRLSVHPDEDDVEDERRAYVRRDDRSSFGDLKFAAMLSDLDPGVEEEEEEDQVDDEDGMDDVISDGVLGENGTTRNLRELMGADANMDEDEGPFDPNETEGEPTFQFNIVDRSRTSMAPEDVPTEHLDDVITAVAEFGREANSYVEESFLPAMDQELDDDDSEVEDQAENPEAGDPPDVLEPHDPTEYLAEDDPTVDPAHNATETIVSAKAAKVTTKTPRILHQSKHGIPYPSLPAAVIKKLASTFSRSAGGNGKINKETVAALTEASDWFFEQVSEDLAAYAGHARRKRIDESDMIALMKR
jgi:histone H3/H4